MAICAIDMAGEARQAVLTRSGGSGSSPLLLQAFAETAADDHGRGGGAGHLCEVAAPSRDHWGAGSDLRCSFRYALHHAWRPTSLLSTLTASRHTTITTGIRPETKLLPLLHGASETTSAGRLILRPATAARNLSCCFPTHRRQVPPRVPSGFAQRLTDWNSSTSEASTGTSLPVSVWRVGRRIKMAPPAL